MLFSSSCEVSSVVSGNSTFLCVLSVSLLLVSCTCSFEIYSLDGKTSIIINDDEIEIKDNASGDDEGDNNNILIDENGINITDTNKNNILLNSDGISITDKNDNKITLSNSGTKIEDKNGNVIEMGTTSVKINNNLEVLQ